MSFGIIIKRDDVMRLLKEIDPEGNDERRRNRLNRRVYVSSGPNECWHIDGYDKLKPYGLPIHGCVDGFSHIIIWLNVVRTNNNPIIPASLYVESVQELVFCPKKMRTDLGTENGIMADMHCYLVNDMNAHSYWTSVPIERTSTDIKTNEKKSSSPIIKRTKFPFMLSWACSVHKVQGLSLNTAVISFDLLRQRSFNSGQMYVALSRVKSIQGMFLIGKFNLKAITVDAKAKQEYEFLRAHQKVSLRNWKSEGNLTFIFCNVRSLSKHLSDIQADQAFTSCNLIFALKNLPGFNSICNNDSDHRFSSLAVYHDNSTSLNEECRISRFLLLEISNEKNHSFKNSSPL